MATACETIERGEGGRGGGGILRIVPTLVSCLIPSLAGTVLRSVFLLLLCICIASEVELGLGSTSFGELA